MRALKQLVRFGWEQALSCLFPVVIFASLAFTQIMPLPFLPRYDWLLIICLLMQWWMVRSGLETRDELKVITLFHLIGLALELFKVHMGSWSYPEEGYSTYEVDGTRYRMPLALSFVLIGFFIWIAENIATFFGAWEYPNQTDAWSPVHLGKVSSWLLLVIVSFLIVATLKQVKGKNSIRIDASQSL
ncbi:DUF817 family protein [Alkalihalobacillus sp. BA299]|uniref:DUF817 family protein n=1 Tax=Alkalihalobacillus sp. BA299 TaxID=2815938 RepID=UPI001AD9FC4C|nr:DUF817 family protein [Alkalihalobacillus sp. BA299]